MADQIPTQGPFNVAQWLFAPNLNPQREAIPYLIQGPHTLSRGQCWALSGQVAAALATLGLRPGQRVALLLAETLAFAPCFWGVVRAGGVAVPFNPLLRPENHRFFLEDSQAAVLLADPALWGPLAPLLSELERPPQVVLARPEGWLYPLNDEPQPALGASLPKLPSGMALHQMAALCAPHEGQTFETVMATPDAPAFWLYTSGSTGQPKAAIHLHRGLPQAAALYPGPVLGLQPAEKLFSAPKFFFAYGLGNSLLFPLACGASAVILGGPPEPEALLATLEAHRPALFFAVPSQLARLVDWAQAQQAQGHAVPRLDFLRQVVSAGEPLSAGLFHRFVEAFGVEPLDGLGTTELFHMVIANRPGRARPGATGTLVEGCRARLAAPPPGVESPAQLAEAAPGTHPPMAQWPEAAPGQPGWLLAQTPAQAAGYWNRPAQTQAGWQDGWFFTGDVMTRDAGGWFSFVGRADEMMKIGGSFVAPLEVEAALALHPAVADCAVAGQRDENGLTWAKAFVVLRDGYQPDDTTNHQLTHHLMARLPQFKVPRRMAFVHHLPRTPSGKLERYKLALTK